VASTNPIARALISLVSGAAIGQLILVAVTPVLSRLYGPSDFGGFATLTAVVAVIGPVAALQFDSGVILPKSRDEAAYMVRLALASSITTSLATAACIWALMMAGLVTGWTAVPFAPLWAGALVLATSVFTVLTQAALRNQDYRVIALRGPIQSAGVALGQVGLAFVLPSATGLLGGFLFGRLLGFVPLARAGGDLLRRPESGSLRATARAYWRLPALLMPASLVNSAGSQLPLLLIAAGFGDHIAGEFGMAQRLVSVPVTLIGASVAQLVGSELARLMREALPGARRLYLRTSARLLAAAVVLGAIIVIAAPLVVPFFLGEEWATTGYIAQAVSISAMAALIGSPLSQAYTVYQSRATIIVDVLRVGLVMGAWAVCAASAWGPVEASWALAAAQVVGYVVLWSYGLRLVSRNEPVPV
jgi:O-antigen/teichoic acid export membrane protein